MNGKVKIGEVGQTGNAIGEKPHLHIEHIDKEGTSKISKANNKTGPIGLAPGIGYRLNPLDSLPNSKKPRYFIWRSEDGLNTCDECHSRDRKQFEYGIDEEPPLHLNCECYVEDVEYDDIFYDFDDYEPQFGELESEHEDEDDDISKIEENIEKLTEYIQKLYDEYYITQNPRLIEIIKETESELEEWENVLLVGYDSTKNNIFELEYKFLRLKNIKFKYELAYSVKLCNYIRTGTIF